MKRRSFIGALTSFLLLPLREIVEAVCNPSVVHFFHHGRQLVQARGNNGKSPGAWFLFPPVVRPFEFSDSFGQPNQSRRRPQLQRHAGHSSRRGDREQRSFHP